MRNWLVELVEHIGRVSLYRLLVFLSLTLSLRCRRWRLSHFSLCWKPYFHFLFGFFFFFLSLSFAIFFYSVHTATDEHLSLWILFFQRYRPLHYECVCLLFDAVLSLHIFRGCFLLLRYFCYSYSASEICLGLNNFLFIIIFFFFFFLL